MSGYNKYTKQELDAAYIMTCIYMGGITKKNKTSENKISRNKKSGENIYYYRGNISRKVVCLRTRNSGACNNHRRRHQKCPLDCPCRVD